MIGPDLPEAIADTLHPDKRVRAIEGAMGLFWEKSFEDVSIGDVVQATGLNRYNLYQHFGDKKGLFLAVLDHYHAHGKQLALHYLSQPDMTAFDALIGVIKSKMSDESHIKSGCLLISTAVEQANKDDEVADRVQQYLGEIKGMMQAAVSRAHAEGDIAHHVDPNAAAEILYNLFLGAGVQSRMGVPQETIEANMNAAFSSLRPIKD